MVWFTKGTMDMWAPLSTDFYIGTYINKTMEAPVATFAKPSFW